SCGSAHYSGCVHWIAGRCPSRSLFPYTALFRSGWAASRSARARRCSASTSARCWSMSASPANSPPATPPMPSTCRSAASARRARARSTRARCRKAPKSCWSAGAGCARASRSHRWRRTHAAVTSMSTAAWRPAGRPRREGAMTGAEAGKADNARWDARYGPDGYVFGIEPNTFLASQLHRLSPGMSVLAVADGEGRNGVWLAGQGLEVLSVDASGTGLEKARKLAAERGVRIVTELADLGEWDWGAE